MNRIDLHRNICNQLTETYRKKNKDYGNSFKNTRDEIDGAIIVRLSDKLERLKSIYKNKEIQVKDETVEDTLLDMANYCIMELIEREIDKNSNTMDKLIQDLTKRIGEIESKEERSEVVRSLIEIVEGADVYEKYQ